MAGGVSLNKDEISLRNGDLLLNELIKALPAAVLVFSPDFSKLLYANAMFERLFGRPVSELYERPFVFLNYIHPDDRERIKMEYREQFNGEEKLDYRIVLPDGTFRWVRDSVSAIWGNSGEIVGIVRFIEDNTEQRLMTNCLKDSLQTSINVMQVMPSGLLIFLYEPEDTFILIDGNSTAERILGLSIEEHRYAKIEEIYPKAKELGIVEMCKNVMKTGMPVETREIYLQDGDLGKDIRLRFFSITSDQLGVSLEDTSRLEKLTPKSSSLYADGMADIYDNLLHNIGNTLNSVLTGIDTIYNNLSDNKLLRYFKSLAKAVERHQEDFAEYVTNDDQGRKVVPFLLALAKDMENLNKMLLEVATRVREQAIHASDIIRTEKSIRKVSVYRKEIDLRRSIESAFNFLMDSIQKRNIEAIIECQDAPQEILMFENQFQQVLVNLIKNSVEAIDELHRQPDCLLLSNATKDFIKVKSYIDGNDFVVEVQDNGIGIPEHEIDKIFLRGYTTKPNGNGLGLSYVFEFITSINGRVHAISEGRGKGATIRIVLPKDSILCK